MPFCPEPHIPVAVARDALIVTPGMPSIVRRLIIPDVYAVRSMGIDVLLGSLGYALGTSVALQRRPQSDLRLQIVVIEIELC